MHDCNSENQTNLKFAVQLEYQVEDQLFLLEAGDSLLFAAQLKHRWHNPGGLVTNVLIIISDYSDNDQPAAHMEKIEK